MKYLKDNRSSSSLDVIRTYQVVKNSVPLKNLNVFFIFHSNITKFYEMIDLLFALILYKNEDEILKGFEMTSLKLKVDNFEEFID